MHRRYTLHGASHMLGLDVHDCAHARETSSTRASFDEGYVLTVEPGLYFQPNDLTVPEEYRGIGVRIEDDVLVTATGRGTSRLHSRAQPTRSRRGWRTSGERARRTWGSDQSRTRTGSERGPRIWPGAQVTLAGSARVKRG